MANARMRLLTVGAMGALLALGVAVSPGGSVAQDAATPAADEGRPVHIHSGSCDELGEVVAPLTNLTLTEGEFEGSDGAVQAETSVTTVALTLDQMLAEDHAVNAHLSGEEVQTYIACGDIGGVRLIDGAIAIGLQPVEGSGYWGVAYLAPGADGASTNVSVFVFEGDGGADADLEEAADAVDEEDEEATPES
jgi:hypothetical protein